MKLCINCEWHDDMILYKDKHGPSYCTHKDTRELVTGGFGWCGPLRSIGASCGPDGRLYQEGRITAVSLKEGVNIEFSTRIELGGTSNG